MQFRSLEPPEIILLAIEFSLKSARFLAMPCRGRYYIIIRYSISTLKLNFSPVRGSILMRFRLLEPPEFILFYHQILFKICCEIYILRQFEIIIICMPLIFGHSMQKLKNKMKSSKASLASWPCQRHIILLLLTKKAAYV